jgi:hypothetical protein
MCTVRLHLATSMETAMAIAAKAEASVTVIALASFQIADQ